MIEKFKWSVSNTLDMHKELLLDDESKEKVLSQITVLQEKMEEIKTLYGYV